MYPLEIISIIKNKVFYINSYLTKNEETPLMTYDEKFSRYEFCIINEDKKVTVANIPVRETIPLLKKSKVYLEKHLDMCSSTSSEVSIAYTTTFMAGKCKGRTPAQILLEETDGKEIIKEQYEYYKKAVDDPEKKNFAKRNQKLLDAMKEAAGLFAKGELSNEQNIKKVDLYLSSTRLNPYKQRSDGMCPVRDMAIRLNLGNLETFANIEITNYYAPYNKLSNGLNVPIPDKMDKNSFVKNSMNLSLEEWLNVVYFIEMDMRRFELLQSKNSYETAQRLNKEQKEKISEEKTN